MSTVCCGAAKNSFLLTVPKIKNKGWLIFLRSSDRLHLYYILYYFNFITDAGYHHLQHFYRLFSAFLLCNDLSLLLLLLLHFVLSVLVHHKAVCNHLLLSSIRNEDCCLATGGVFPHPCVIYFNFYHFQHALIKGTWVDLKAAEGVFIVNTIKPTEIVNERVHQAWLMTLLLSLLFRIWTSLHASPTQ